MHGPQAHSFPEDGDEDAREDRQLTSARLTGWNSHDG
jgi:hypothetical protein